jgi:hypothetical protein
MNSDTSTSMLSPKVLLARLSCASSKSYDVASNMLTTLTNPDQTCMSFDIAKECCKVLHHKNLKPSQGKLQNFSIFPTKLGWCLIIFNVVITTLPCSTLIFNFLTISVRRYAGIIFFIIIYFIILFLNKKYLLTLNSNM